MSSATDEKFTGGILVVGATGKAGTPTIEQLIAAGATKIRILVRDINKAK